MSKRILQELVGRALIDRDFEWKLLHRPAEVVKVMNLPPEEAEAVLSIKANNLAQFAGELHVLIYGKGNLKCKAP